MVLEGKTAIVYGGGGAIGGAVSRAFARQGARVFLTGRSRAPLEQVAAEIRAGGGVAETAQLDALDPAAVAEHAASVVRTAGRLDISFNAVDLDEVQNVPLVEMRLEDFMSPIVKAARTHFVTATTAARLMSKQRSGVIVLLSSSATLESRHQMGGFNLACALVEALTRSLAGEVGRLGVRVVGLRPNFTPETRPGLREEDLPFLVEDTVLGRLPRLAEVAAGAVYLASDAAAPMSGAVLNLSCGAVLN